MLSRIRHNMSRKVAVLAILAVVLVGSGISSLAQLNDNLRVQIDGSVTTIDFQVNGTKDLVFALPDGIEPGDIAYVPLHFTNSGSGYVNTTSSAISITGQPPLTTDTTKQSFWGVAPEVCNAAGMSAHPKIVAWDANSTPLNTGLWDNQITVGAGEAQDLCVAVRVGVVGASYPAGGTVFSAAYQILGWYP